jgi:aspartyl/glutamyl-tRNA(Asn/Gln) amidotransferase C subunit
MAKKQLKLSNSQIKRLNRLARIRSGERETSRIKKQLLATLRSVELLNQLDTTKVLPLNQVTGLKNVGRKDKVSPSLSVEEALSNASDQHNCFFKIRPIFKD